MTKTIGKVPGLRVPSPAGSPSADAAGSALGVASSHAGARSGGMVANPTLPSDLQGKPFAERIHSENARLLWRQAARDFERRPEFFAMLQSGIRFFAAPMRDGELEGIFADSPPLEELVSGFDPSNFVRLTLRQSIRGQTLVAVAMGDELDAVPAAFISTLLEKEGRRVLALVSVVSVDFMAQREASLKKLEKISGGIYRDAQTLPLRRYFLVDEGVDLLQERLRSLLQYLEDADNVIAFGTGGSLLFDSQELAQSSVPEVWAQRFRVLTALRRLQLQGQSVQTLLFAPGLEAPQDAPYRCFSMSCGLLSFLDPELRNSPFVPVNGAKFATVLVQELHEHALVALGARDTLGKLVQAYGEENLPGSFDERVLRGAKGLSLLLGIQQLMGQFFPIPTPIIDLGKVDSAPRSLEEVARDIFRTFSTVKLFATLDQLLLVKDFKAAFHDPEAARLSCYSLVWRLAQLNFSNPVLSERQQSALLALLKIPRDRVAKLVFQQARYEAFDEEDCLGPQEVFEALLTVRHCLSRSWVNADPQAAVEWGKSLYQATHPTGSKVDVEKILPFLF